MIINVPTSEDFAKHGLMFLNLAWNTVFDLLLDFKDANDWESIVDDEQTESYWQAAKRPLSMAHALAQQGAEVVLKSEIAVISPFLLVSAPAADWPRGCDKTNTAFADFRTMDAQDLIRACNAVRPTPLPKQFVTTYDDFRKQRNALFHTVDNRLSFSEKEIIWYILSVAQLIRPGQWPAIRKEHLEESPAFKAYAVDYVTNRLCCEMDAMIDLLQRSDLLEWFGFDKKQRRYICPHCYWDLNHDNDPPHPRTAQLRPNTPQSRNLFCFVCGSQIPVIRKKCKYPNCKGNVIHSTADCECLTCFESQGDAD